MGQVSIGDRLGKIESLPFGGKFKYKPGINRLRSCFPDSPRALTGNDDVVFSVDASKVSIFVESSLSSMYVCCVCLFVCVYECVYLPNAQHANSIRCS